jgi:hypothetical protein
LHRKYKQTINIKNLNINNLNIYKMKTEVTKTGFANHPVERKEFAGKAQMPKVLRGILTTL